MADNIDFLNKEQEAQEEIAKIKLGEVEYDPKELQAFVDKGKKVDEFAKKYNTDPDKAWSAYGKTTQENKTLKEELDELKKQNEIKQEVKNGDLTDEQIQQAREQAKKIGIVTTGDLDSWYQSRRAAERLLEDCGGHEGEITGEDGRPKFVTEDILKHMEETGIKNPLKAYKDKFEKELDEWKASELGKERGNDMPTMKAPGAKQPKRVVVTKDNIGQLIHEQLAGGRNNE